MTLELSQAEAEALADVTGAAAYGLSLQTIYDALTDVRIHGYPKFERVWEVGKQPAGV